MREVADLPDFAALVAHLNKMHGPLNQHCGVPPYRPEQIKVAPYVITEGRGPIWDDRIGWHTYIVTVDGNAVGFTNGPLT